MSRDWRAYLGDMDESCRRILHYTQGMDQGAFISDSRTYDAVIRNLEILGEAAKHIPPEIREAALDVNWRGVCGLRDMIAHDYFGMDNDILWDVITHKIEELLISIQKLNSL